MNVLKNIAISTMAMGTMAVPLLAPAASASRGHAQKPVKPQQCRVIDARQQHLIDHFWFGSNWQVQRFQQLVNRENKLNCVADKTSYDYLNEFGNFESLSTALRYTGLDKTLDSPGQFTVFAPTDDAFAKLPAGLVNGLLTDPAQKSALTNILLYHVVSGASVNADTAKTLTEATMANGTKVNVKVQGGNLFINDSKVILYDIRTTNGVIHVIDTVLVP